jgi:hypothetical protein
VNSGSHPAYLICSFVWNKFVIGYAGLFFSVELRYSGGLLALDDARGEVRFTLKNRRRQPGLSGPKSADIVL